MRFCRISFVFADEVPDLLSFQLLLLVGRCFLPSESLSKKQ